MRITPLFCMRLNSVCDASPPPPQHIPPSYSCNNTHYSLFQIPYCTAPSHRLSIRGSTPLHAFSTVKHTLLIPSILYRIVYHTLFKPSTVQASYSSTHSQYLQYGDGHPPHIFYTPPGLLITSIRYFTNLLKSSLWYHTALPSNTVEHTLPIPSIPYSCIEYILYILPQPHTAPEAPRPGVTKRCRLSWPIAPSYVSPNAGGGVCAGLQPMSTVSHVLKKFGR